MLDLQTAQQQIAALKQENQALKAQLMQAQKLSSVGALSASITHEFNNILTTVINYAKMGLRHKDAKTREKAFDKILSAGQRASKITTGMLGFVRNQGNRQEPMELTELVQDVMVLMSKDLQMHRVKVDLNLIDNVQAEVNACQIQQVLMNLIVNGRQAMPEGGRMIISVRKNEAESKAEIAVRDFGSGIPADKLRKIFAPFFSTKTADEQGQGGTGLGLALCRDIIEAHRGRIRVESAPGQGTTFILKFPLITQPAGLISTSQAVSTISNKAG